MKKFLLLLFVLSSCFISMSQDIYKFNKSSIFVNDSILYRETSNHNSFEIDYNNKIITHINFENKKNVYVIKKGIFNVDYTILVLNDLEGNEYILRIGSYFILFFDNITVMFE